MALSTVMTVKEIRTRIGAEKVKLTVDLDDPTVQPDFWFASGDVDSVWIELHGDDIGTMKLDQRFRFTIEQVRAKRKEPTSSSSASTASTPAEKPADDGGLVELEVVLGCTHIETATVPAHEVDDVRATVGEAFHCKECAADVTILTVEPKVLA